MNDIVNMYNKLVFKICYDMLGSAPDAQDISQEAFLSFYLHLNDYINLPQNEIKNILCKIALNKCKDFLRGKTHKLKLLTNDDDTNLENYEDDNNILEELIKKENSNYITKIINELKEPYSSIIKYYYIENLSLDELAKKLDTQKSTLKVQLYRAKKLLQKEVEKTGGENLL